MSRPRPHRARSGAQSAQSRRRCIIWNRRSRNDGRRFDHVNSDSGSVHALGVLFCPLLESTPTRRDGWWRSIRPIPARPPPPAAMSTPAPGGRGPSSTAWPVVMRTMSTRTPAAISGVGALRQPDRMNLDLNRTRTQQSKLDVTRSFRWDRFASKPTIPRQERYGVGSGIDADMTYGS